MGIMSNKVSRRIALGSIAAGLGGTALVFRGLKGKYEVNVPEGNEPRKFNVKWEGKEIPLEIPRGIAARTPEDKKELRAAIEKQLKDSPVVKELSMKTHQEWIEKNKEIRMAELDKQEQDLLKKVADLPNRSEEEKLVQVKLIKVEIEKARKNYIDYLATIKPPTQ